MPADPIKIVPLSFSCISFRVWALLSYRFTALFELVNLPKASRSLNVFLRTWRTTNGSFAFPPISYNSLCSLSAFYLRSLFSSWKTHLPKSSMRDILSSSSLIANSSSVFYADNLPTLKAKWSTWLCVLPPWALTFSDACSSLSSDYESYWESSERTISSLVRSSDTCSNLLSRTSLLFIFVAYNYNRNQICQLIKS